MTDFPRRIRELLDATEVDNVEHRRGWAIGTVARTDETGDVVERYENAVIELFNGEGGAGQFGGVRFMWADDSVEYENPWDDNDGYEEAYAHATRAALDRNGSHPAWFVDEYTDPADPEYGQPSP